MAIRDRDGNIYRLRGPNPMMNQQTFWDTKSLRFMNMKPDDDFVSIDARNPSEAYMKEYSVRDIKKLLALKSNKEMAETHSAEEFFEDFLENQAKEDHRSPVPEPEPVPQPIINERVESIIRQNSVTFWVVPVVVKEVKDPLYGEVRRTKSYGDKQNFVGVVILEDDLRLSFWTTHKVTVGSIVFPKKSERWWKIDEVEEKTGGFLAECFPSDVNPDFS